MGRSNNLSPSALAEFRDCPRCFYLGRKEGVPKPRGIFPSLPSGIDGVLKRYYDACRAKGIMPSEVETQGVIPGKLYPDQESLKRWRTWGKGRLMAEVHGWPFVGMVDDLIEEPDGSVSILDYKTKGSAPKDGDTERYYGHQADGYHLLLESAGVKPSGKAYFAYYFPLEATGAEATAETWFAFKCQVVTITTDPARAANMIGAAVECLGGALPEAAYGCETCQYLRLRYATVNAKQGVAV